MHYHRKQGPDGGGEEKESTGAQDGHAYRRYGGGQTQPGAQRRQKSFWRKLRAGRRQLSSAQSSTRKQRAFRENVAAGLAKAMAKPPSAGPSARATLKPTPFNATAWIRSSRDTNSGIAAAQAGKMTAVPAPIRK